MFLFFVHDGPLVSAVWIEKVSTCLSALRKRSLPSDLPPPLPPLQQLETAKHTASDAVVGPSRYLLPSTRSSFAGFSITVISKFGMKLAVCVLIKSYTRKHRTRVWVPPFGYLRRLQEVGHLAKHMSTACSQMSKVMNLAIYNMHGKQAAHYENKNTSIKYYLTI